MRLVFAGTPEVALPSLEAIAASGHDLVAVLTRPDAPAGRGRRLVHSPVGAWADDHGLAVLTPERPRDPDFLRRLVELAPDCVPVVAYGALVPPAALAIPRHGWINLHFSLLPAWRGAAPVQHAVLHGDEVTGASVFQLEEGLDTGPVYGRLVEKIGPRDTAGDLLARLARTGSGLLASVLDAIADGNGAGPAPARRRHLARTQDHCCRRRGALARSGLRGRPPRPGLHARARRVDYVLRRAGQAGAGRAGSGRAAAGAGGVAGGEVQGPRGYGHRAGRARRGPSAGSQGDAGRGLGPRGPGQGGERLGSAAASETEAAQSRDTEPRKPGSRE